MSMTNNNMPDKLGAEIQGKVIADRVEKLGPKARAKILDAVEKIGMNKVEYYEGGVIKPVVKSFIIGTSYPIVIWAMIYIASTEAAKEGTFKYYEWFPVLMPIAFGVVNALANVFPARSSTSYTARMVLVGILFGVVSGLIYVFALDAPKRAYHIDEPSQKYAPIFIAPVVFAVIWGAIANWTNRYFGLASLTPIGK